MRVCVALLATSLFLACRASSNATPQADSPYAATSGVNRMGETSNAVFHVAPLHVMTGDVEILSGDPEKAGEPFVIRIHELPGTIIPLHSHPVDENITVVQGTWYFAVGTTWDKAALHELRAGDYAFAPKGSTMYGYCPDGAVVQVHGIGPFLIHWMHGAKTLNDSDAARTFKFRKGERVATPRGNGVIKEGYASGDVVQYEIEAADGTRFMANESETQRL